MIKFIKECGCDDSCICVKCGKPYDDVPKEETSIPSERNIGFLRQWLNEDRKCEPCVTNDEIKYWLNLK